MKKTVIIALVTFASLFASAARDTWVESGEMLRYRHDTYFTAVGMSTESSEAAKNNAIAEVRKQISVEVNATEITREYDRYSPTTGSHSNNREFESRTRLASAGDLQGVEIIATAQRGDIQYAFAALDKELFVANGKAKIQTLNDELERRYNVAQRALVQSDVVTVLSEVGSAREILKEIIDTRLLLTAATTLTENDAPSYSEGDLNSLYESVVVSIEVEKIVGDRQKVIIGAVPAEPFIVKVSAHGQPVPFMPFKLVDEDGDEILRRASNISGEVVFFLGEDAQTSKGNHSYEVIPAIDLSRDMRMRLRELTSRFVYKVLGNPSYARIEVEVPSDLEEGSDEIRAAAVAMLGEYDILEDSCSCTTVKVSVSAEPGEYVQGVSETRTFQRSSVSTTITVTDENGRGLFSTVKSGGGTGSNMIQSVVSAVEAIRIQDDISDMKNAIGTETDTKKAAEDTRKKIVIFDFQNSSSRANWYETADAITAMVTTAMINTGAFVVIERDQINRIVQEKNFAGDELDFARLAGADYAIVGNASQQEGVIEIDARLVNMKTANAVGVASVTGSSMRDLRSLSEELISDITLDGVALGTSVSTKQCGCE